MIGVRLEDSRRVRRVRVSPFSFFRMVSLVAFRLRIVFGGQRIDQKSIGLEWRLLALPNRQSGCSQRQCSERWGLRSRDGESCIRSFGHVVGALGLTRDDSLPGD